jgi:hypothetical protein
MNNNNKITDLTFVGTHDSAAYQFSGVYMPDDIVPGLSMKFLEFLRKFCCIKQIINDWTLTQDQSIYNQLQMGIRVLDLRLSQVNNVLMLSHSFSCLYLKDFFIQLQQFILENPTEIIIIAIKPDWIHRNGVTVNHWNQFYTMANEYIGNSLYPRAVETPTVQQCIDTHKNVFIDIYYDGMIDSDIPENFWINFVNRFNQGNLFDSPSNDIVKQDVIHRIFCKCFGYQKKTLRNFSKTPEEFYNTFQTPNEIRIWWMDFPSLSFVNKLRGLI